MRYALIMKTTTLGRMVPKVGFLFGHATTHEETLAQRIARLDHEYDRVKRLEQEQADAAAKEGAK
jgi:hypothetical protein